MTIQSLYGIFPNVIGKGRYARQVFELMNRMRREIGVDSDPPISPQFDTLLILDRTVDLTTPVVTQLTYEGLIDEFYGIKHSEKSNHELNHHDHKSTSNSSTSMF